MWKHTVLGLLAFGQFVQAHEHHAVELIDTGVSRGVGIWVHAVIQSICWGILFPVGMILGMNKNRYHVPLQAATMCLSSAGYVLGHHHGGRQYPATAHGPIATGLIAFMVVQSALGVYLKLHLPQPVFRRAAVIIHGFVGRLYPLIGGIQILMGANTFLSYCLGEEALQCYAHHTFGVSFVLFATLLSIAMHLGTGWIRNRGKSQEFYESLMIMTFGIINTFSMRHSDGWSHKDLQHTMLGVLWWTGGALGILLSVGQKRNFVPSFVFIATGFAFAGHVQELEISAFVHKVLGTVLGAAGICRIVEICFLLEDNASGEGPRSEGARGVKVAGFQHLYPFLLVVSGLIFISATNEELMAVDKMGLDGVTYMLIMFSLAFFVYFVINGFISFYIATIPSPDAGNERGDSLKPLENGYGRVRMTEALHRTDAEAYELDDRSDEAEDVRVDSFEQEFREH